MVEYADTSFLVSSYLLDSHTSEAMAYVQSTTPTFVFTALHDLEVRCAFEQSVFRQMLSTQQAASARQQLVADVSAGRLTAVDVRWRTIFRLASALAQRYSAATGARSLDVLHVAVARSLRLRRFASFDLRQRALASAAGMTVVP
jgi:predicted nucleic acid-binding protein